MSNYTLEDVIKHLDDDGIDGVTTDIVDYDWHGDTVREEGRVRVEIWLKREEAND